MLYFNNPGAGSASTLRVCREIERSCYGFEIEKNFYQEAKKIMLAPDNKPEQLAII